MLGFACLVVSAAQIVGASTPANGRLDVDHQSVSWAGGPLTGAAPVFRRLTCNPGVNCDDFTLEVNLPKAAFTGVPVMHIEATTQAPNAIEILLYEPGKEPSPAENTFTQYGSVAKVRAPKAGAWTVRINCSPCSSAMYTAKATVETIVARNDAPAFVNKVMPGPSATVSAGAAEPGVEIGPSGEVWINGPNAVANFWGSYDGGKTFTLRRPDISPTSGDTWLTIGPDGTLYADNLSHAGGTNLVYVSRDKGKTWSEIPFVANTDSDRQWLTADPHHPGTVYFEYHELASGNNVWVWKSTDYGQTWLPISHISVQEMLKVGSPDTPLGNTTGPIVFAPDGTMHFVINFNNFAESATTLPTEQDFNLDKIYVLTSTDGGVNWAFSLARDSMHAGRVHHGFSWVSPDSKGNLYLVWSERPSSATTTDVFLATSRDKGVTWSAPVRVSRNGASNIFPAIGAEGDPGRVSLAWLESASKDFNDKASKWKVKFAHTDNAFDSKPSFQYLQASPDVVHESDVCQAGTLCLATGGNRSMLDYIYMDIDKQGYAHVAYTDDTSGLRTVYAKQITGPRNIGPAVLGTRRTKPATKPSGGRLPATGVETGVAGLLLLGTALLLGRRARLVR